MNRNPTVEQLQAAGIDADALLDAIQRELEQAIPMAANENARAGLEDDLKALNVLRDEWLGDAA